MVAALSHVLQRLTVSRLLVRLFVNALPDGFNALFIIKALEDTVAPDHEKVEVWL